MRSSGRWLDAQAQIPTEVTKVKVILGKNLAGKVTNLKYEEWTTGTWIFSMCLCMNVRRFNVSYWCARTKGLNTDISLLSLPFKTILLIWAKVLNVAPKQNKRLFKQWTFFGDSCRILRCRHCRNFFCNDRFLHTHHQSS